MFQDKLEAELSQSLDCLLPRRQNYLAMKQFSPIKIQPIAPNTMTLLAGPVEYTPSQRKKKKWVSRHAILRPDKLTINKSSQVRRLLTYFLGYLISTVFRASTFRAN